MTSRRSFLASVAAAIAGRALVRKPAPETGVTIRVIRRWDSDLRGWRVRMDVVQGYGSLFNPREDLAAQYLLNRWNPPAPWVFRA